MPSSIAKKILLERSGHDFELLQDSQNLKTRPYSKQQVAKNNFTTEPNFFAIPDWRVVLYFYTVKQKASIQIMLVVNRLYI